MGRLDGSGCAPKRSQRQAAGVAALGLLAAGCAGSSGPPEASASPTSATAVSLADVTLTMIPSVGDHVFEWGPGVDPLVLRPALSWNLEFVAPADVSELWIRVQLLRADGTPCLLGTERVGRIVRGERYIAFGDRFDLPEVEPLWRSFCSNRFATETVAVNLLDGPIDSSSEEPPVIQDFEFTHFYFFNRVGFSPEGNGSSSG